MRKALDEMEKALLAKQASKHQQVSDSSSEDDAPARSNVSKAKPAKAPEPESDDDGSDTETTDTKTKTKAKAKRVSKPPPAAPASYKPAALRAYLSTMNITTFKAAIKEHEELETALSKHGISLKGLSSLKAADWEKTKRPEILTALGSK